MRKAVFLAPLALAAAFAQDFPQAQITNGLITARLYLPDPANGYYRATRFDWSGVIPSLTTKNHSYFGQWFEKYDPKLHDAIQGPVEEFKTGDAALGYTDAQPGGIFVRIGVGALRKPEERQFNSFRTYDIVDGGRWQVEKKKDQVRFTHTLGAEGYAYVYKKTVRLVKGKSTMVLEHELKNTGSKKIETSQYDHNFFMMDNQPTGPDASVRFPFALQPVRPFQGNLAETRGGEIIFNKELQPKQSVYGEFKGFGPGAADYDIRLEHKKAGAGVRIRGDVPLEKVVFWSIRTTFCPEPYVKLTVEPGKTVRWTYTYDFYDLPPTGK
jgi:hypothetical protein